MPLPNLSWYFVHEIDTYNTYDILLFQCVELAKKLWLIYFQQIHFRKCILGVDPGDGGGGLKHPTDQRFWGPKIKFLYPV